MFTSSRALVLVLAAAGCTKSASTVPSHRGDARPPPVEDIKRVVHAIHDATSNVTPGDPKLTAAAGLIGIPFVYDGLEYIGDGGGPDEACTKKWGASGTVKSPADVPGFLSCLAKAIWAGALDGEASWATVDPAQLPPSVAKFKPQLTALAPDHALALSHFTPAGPADYWNVYAASRDKAGTVRLDALLVYNESSAEP
jgi:hypothetical protein